MANPVTERRELIVQIASVLPRAGDDRLPEIENILIWILSRGQLGGSIQLITPVEKYRKSSTLLCVSRPGNETDGNSRFTPVRLLYAGQRAGR